ncbi:4-hydroxybenzoate octaprenyltransferase [Yunchengibacter salinarum]|uniref:4-hydroxybenzoate octaprenyltransferase n=1 Tax=Yunchengibacter salinarum TaxID=3133399 RepID=UPI0035B6AA2F
MSEHPPIRKTADAVAGSWVYRHAPARTRPYLKLARLDRPVGAWLVLWPSLWSLVLGGWGVLPPAMLVLYATLFAIGAVAMRGAGCTINDLADRHIDARVERTRARPLPAGEVSVTGAVAFLGLQCAVGLLILVQFNAFAIVLGVASVGLVALYPFMKRVTYWPQIWLGMTINWGALMGWAAARGSLDPAPLVLYLGAAFWTIGYDTIYAHQDREDDILAGVKSSALALGRRTRPAVALFYGLFLLALAIIGQLAKLHPIYYAGLVFAGAHLIWQVARTDIDRPDQCLTVFRSNIRFGAIVLGALVAGQVAGQAL